MNSLTFMHIMYRTGVCVCVYKVPHVRVRFGDYLLQKVDMFDFEGTETTGNRILLILRHLIQFTPCVGFHNKNPLY